MSDGLRATVLIPTMSGRGPLLPYSVGSVLAQTVPEIEVFVMGDGVDDATRNVVHQLMARDDRVKFFDHPKHERRGEPHRHAALAGARGAIVCYLCDRDLMLPDHIATMEGLLRDADFAHTMISMVVPDMGVIPVSLLDVADSADLHSLVNGQTLDNSIPLSTAGHTLAMYRKLPHGWRTTPPGVATDMHMWAQFAARPECRGASGTAPTIAYFPTSMRPGWTVAQRLDELRRYAEQFARPGGVEAFLRDLIASLARDRLAKGRKLRDIFAGKYSRLNRLKRAWFGRGG